MLEEATRRATKEGPKRGNKQRTQKEEEATHSVYFLFDHEQVRQPSSNDLGNHARHDTFWERKSPRKGELAEAAHRLSGPAAITAEEKKGKTERKERTSVLLGEEETLCACETHEESRHKHNL